MLDEQFLTDLIAPFEESPETEAPLDTPNPKPKKGETYADMARRIAREHGVDPDLIAAQMSQESANKPAAKSWAGAGGLMQLMPGTASRYKVTDVNNPEQNIRAGVQHMRYLLSRYKGDKRRALVAYNAGEGNADRNDWEHMAWNKWTNLKGRRAIPLAKRPDQYEGSPGEYVDRILGNAGKHKAFTEMPYLYDKEFLKGIVSGQPSGKKFVKPGDKLATEQTETVQSQTSVDTGHGDERIQPPDRYAFPGVNAEWLYGTKSQGGVDLVHPRTEGKSKSTVASLPKVSQGSLPGNAAQQAPASSAGAPGSQEPVVSASPPASLTGAAGGVIDVPSEGEDLPGTVTDSRILDEEVPSSDSLEEVKIENVTPENENNALAKAISVPDTITSASDAEKYVKSQVEAEFGVKVPDSYRFLESWQPGHGAWVSWGDLRKMGVDIDTMIRQKKAEQRALVTEPDLSLSTKYYKEPESTINRIRGISPEQEARENLEADPLYSEAKANLIREKGGDPLIIGSDAELDPNEVMAEYQRLQSNETIKYKQAIEYGKANAPGEPSFAKRIIFGAYGSDPSVQSGLLQVGLGFTNLGAGLSTLFTGGQDNPVTRFLRREAASMEAGSITEKAKNNDWWSTAKRASMSVPGDLLRLGLFLPLGGPVVGFGLAGSIEARGRGTVERDEAGNIIRVGQATTADELRGARSGAISGAMFPVGKVLGKVAGGGLAGNAIDLAVVSGGSSLQAFAESGGDPQATTESAITMTLLDVIQKLMRIRSKPVYGLDPATGKQRVERIGWDYADDTRPDAAIGQIFNYRDKNAGVDLFLTVNSKGEVVVVNRPPKDTPVTFVDKQMSDAEIEDSMRRQIQQQVPGYTAEPGPAMREPVREYAPKPEGEMKVTPVEPDRTIIPFTTKAPADRLQELVEKIETDPESLTPDEMIEFKRLYTEPGPVPETKEALQAQAEVAADPTKPARIAELIPKTQAKADIPAELEDKSKFWKLSMKNGDTLYVSKEQWKTKAAELGSKGTKAELIKHTALDSDSQNTQDLLGRVEAVSDTSEGTAVTASVDGKQVDAAVVSSEAGKEAQKSSMEQQFGTEADIEVKPVQEAVSDRVEDLSLDEKIRRFQEKYPNRSTNSDLARPGAQFTTASGERGRVISVEGKGRSAKYVAQIDGFKKGTLTTKFLNQQSWLFDNDPKISSQARVSKLPERNESGYGVRAGIFTEITGREPNESEAFQIQMGTPPEQVAAKSEASGWVGQLQKGEEVTYTDKRGKEHKAVVESAQESLSRATIRVYKKDGTLSSKYQTVGFSDLKRTYTPPTKVRVEGKVEPEVVSPDWDLEQEQKSKPAPFDTSNAVDAAPAKPAPTRKVRVIRKGQVVNTEATGYTVDGLAQAFDLTPEQAEATDALIKAMGLDTSKLQVVQGGKPGEGALYQAALHGTPNKYSKEILVRDQMGNEIYLVGSPKEFPHIPEGYTVIKEFPAGRPRTDMIGTGEGNQMYGWGLYFADRYGVAEHYRTMYGDGGYVTYQGRHIDRFEPGSPEYIIGSYFDTDQNPNLKKYSFEEMIEETTSFYFDRLEVLEGKKDKYTDIKNHFAKKVENGNASQNDVDELVEVADDLARVNREIAQVEEYQRRLQNIKESDYKVEGESAGHLFRVDMKPTEDQYLRWDYPLSDQSEIVQAAAKAWKESGLSRSHENWIGDDLSGEGFYKDIRNSLGSQKAASLWLLDHGVRGNKFEDGKTRAQRNEPPKIRYKGTNVEHIARGFLDGYDLNQQDVFSDIMFEAQFHRGNIKKAFAAVERKYVEEIANTDSVNSDWFRKYHLPILRSLDQADFTVRYKQIENPTHNYVIFEENDVDIIDVLKQGDKGSTEFTEGGQAILRGLNNPDVSTAVHEVAHVARRTIFDKRTPTENRNGVTDEDIDTVEKWAGVENGDWKTENEEKFARGFERYLRDGKAPSNELQSIFAKFKNWLTKIYTKLKGSEIDVKISPEVRAVFDKWLTGASSESPKAPEVYLTKDDVTQKSSYGEKWNEGPNSVVLKGTIVDKGQLPPELYHVTTATGAVLKAGILRSMDPGSAAGLGKGTSINHKGVSLTKSKEMAELIQREIRRKIELAKNPELGKELLQKYAAEDASLYGVDTSKALEDALKRFEVHKGKEANPGFASYSTYLTARESAGGGQDPIIFGRPETFSKLDPADVSILTVKSADIPDAALIRDDPIGNSFMDEVMVHSEIPVAGARPTADEKIEPPPGKYHGRVPDTITIDGVQVKRVPSKTVNQGFGAQNVADVPVLLEEPTAAAVDALNAAGIKTSASGFMSEASRRWEIVLEDKLPESVIDLAKKHGLSVDKNRIYLPKGYTVARQAEAMEDFNRFAAALAADKAPETVAEAMVDLGMDAKTAEEITTPEVFPPYKVEDKVTVKSGAEGEVVFTDKDSVTVQFYDAEGNPKGEPIEYKGAERAKLSYVTAPADLPKEFGSTNTKFTKERVAKARETIHKNRNKLNTGLDPVEFRAWLNLAGFYVEGGARSFADFSQRMVAEVGERIRPYLRSLYLAVQKDPEFAQFRSEMEDLPALGETGTGPIRIRESVAKQEDQQLVQPGDLDEVKYFNIKHKDPVVQAQRELIRGEGIDVAFTTAMDLIPKTVEDVVYQTQVLTALNNLRDQAQARGNQIAYENYNRQYIELAQHFDLYGTENARMLEARKLAYRTPEEAAVREAEAARARKRFAVGLTKAEKDALEAAAKAVSDAEEVLERRTAQHKIGKNDTTRAAKMEALKAYSAAKQTYDKLYKHLTVPPPSAIRKAVKTTKMAMVSALNTAVTNFQSAMLTHGVYKARDILALALAKMDVALQNPDSTWGFLPSGDSRGSHPARGEQVMLGNEKATVKSVDRKNRTVELVVNGQKLKGNFGYDKIQRTPDPNQVTSEMRFKDILGIPDSNSGPEAFKNYFLSLAKTKGTVDMVLLEHPEFVNDLFGDYNADIEGLDDIRYEQGGTVHKALDMAELVYSTLNTPNKFQEFRMRATVAETALRMRLGARGLSLDQMERDLDYSQITPEDLKFAIEKARRITYSRRPEPGSLGDRLNGFANAYEGVPGLLLVPFANFSYNVASNASDLVPIIAQIKQARNVYKREGRGMEGFKQIFNPKARTPEELASTIVGLAIFGAAYHIVRELGDRDDWWWLRIPYSSGSEPSTVNNPTGSLYIDIRQHPQFAPYVFMANKFNRLMEGKPVFTYQDPVAIAGEVTEAFANLSYRSSIDNNAAIKTLWYGGLSLGGQNELTANDEKALQNAFELFGNYTGVFLSPVRPLKNFLDKAAGSNEKMMDEHPFLKAYARNVPAHWLGGALGSALSTLPDKVDYATGKPKRKNYDWLKPFGFVVESGDNIPRSLTPGEVVAAHMARGAYQPSARPETPAERFIVDLKRDFERASDKARATGDTQALRDMEDKLQSYVADGRLKQVEADQIKRNFKSSDLEENFDRLSISTPRGATASQIEVLWPKLNNEQKELLRPALLEKITRAISDGKLTVDKIPALEKMGIDRESLESQFKIAQIKSGVKKAEQDAITMLERGDTSFLDQLPPNIRKKLLKEAKLPEEAKTFMEADTASRALVFSNSPVDRQAGLVPFVEQTIKNLATRKTPGSKETTEALEAAIASYRRKVSELSMEERNRLAVIEAQARAKAPRPGSMKIPTLKLPKIPKVSLP